MLFFLPRPHKSDSYVFVTSQKAIAMNSMSLKMWPQGIPQQTRKSKQDKPPARECGRKESAICKRKLHCDNSCELPKRLQSSLAMSREYQQGSGKLASNVASDWSGTSDRVDGRNLPRAIAMKPPVANATAMTLSLKKSSFDSIIDNQPICWPLLLVQDKKTCLY